MRRVVSALTATGMFIAATAVLSACNKNPTAKSTGPLIYAKIQGGPHALPPAAAAPADDGNWTMPGKNYAQTRFSALSQITPANVSKLALAFTFSTGTNKGFEAPPLVVNGTMYVITPFPNYLYALDLTKPGAPAKWTFKPKPAAASQGVACCDVVNRGAVYDDGKIFFNTLDGQTIAVDANSGEEVWHTQLGDIQKGETITMAPLVAKGKVLVGNSRRRNGRSRLDRSARRGQRQDRLESLQYRPRQGRADRPAVQAFLRERPREGPRRLDLAARRLEDRRRQASGAGSATIPRLNLLFYGTSNPGPWNPDQRPGDNKWSTGIFARDVDTGQAVWYLPEQPARPLRP